MFCQTNLIKAFILVLIITTYCSKNNPPSISSIDIDPETVLANGITTISVTASDPDGDELFYTWIYTEGSMSGELENCKLSTKDWQAPGRSGIYNIIVEVSDGELTDMDYIDITVLKKDTVFIDTSDSIMSDSYVCKSLDLSEGWIMEGSWNVSGNDSIAFLLLSEEEFYNWSHGEPYSYFVRDRNNAGDFLWVVPFDHRYYFVYYNPNSIREWVSYSIKGSSP